MNAYCQWCALPGASRPDSAAHDQSQSPLASSPITPQRSLTTDRRPGQWERTPRPGVGKSGSAPRSTLLVRSQLPHCFACCSQKLLPASRLLPTRNLHLSTSPTPMWPLWPSSKCHVFLRNFSGSSTPLWSLGPSGQIPGRRGGLHYHCL